MAVWIITIVFYLTLLTGCAVQTPQLLLSTNDPANPNAPESPFSPRPDLLQSGIPDTEEQPPAELLSPTHLPTTYTCPMHPEIIQSNPGKCPACGMKLVPPEPSKTDSKCKQ
ncbi:MAG: hypothetical protein E3K32_04180 [wastewater metagenome]|nr:hypothetical protein [Candidatus Loosdrechtia aerotolerans]